MSTMSFRPAPIALAHAAAPDAVRAVKRRLMLGALLSSTSVVALSIAQLTAAYLTGDTL